MGAFYFGRYMAEKKKVIVNLGCTEDHHRWGKWDAPFQHVAYIEHIDQNLLLQTRQCLDCGKAEARRVV